MARCFTHHNITYAKHNNNISVERTAHNNNYKFSSADIVFRIVVDSADHQPPTHHRPSTEQKTPLRPTATRVSNTNRSRTVFPDE